MHVFLVFDGFTAHPTWLGIIPDMAPFAPGEARELTPTIVARCCARDAASLATMLADPEHGIYRDRFHVELRPDGEAAVAPPEPAPDPAPASSSTPDQTEPVPAVSEGDHNE